MNDLEHDLRAMFHEKAGSIDASPGAPAAVLHRARRRQAGTVLGGAAAVLVAAVVTVLVVRAVSSPTAAVPAQARYGERTATIEGATITAPAGWTLVDDWPLGAGSGVASSPAGRPLFQLANFEPPLLQTACGVGPDGSSRFGVVGSQAVLYVALDEGALKLPGGSTPTKLDPSTAPTTGPCGSGWYARWLVGGRPYLAFAGFGPDVSASDRATVFRSFSEMRQTAVTAQSLPDGVLPGYVIAAGIGDEGTPWRIDAGLTRLEPAAAEPTSVGAWLVGGDTYGGQPPPREQPPTPPQTVSARFDPFSHQVVQWGTAASEVEGIDIVTDDGTTAATTLPWPDALRPYAPDAESMDGSIWFAVVSNVGHVQVHTSGSGGTPQTDWTTGGELPTVVIGGTTEATFDAFDASWTITDDANGVTLQRSSGGETSFHELVNGEGVQVDVPGGTFVLEQTDPNIDRVSVSVDGDGTVEGRWMQTFRDAAGRPGHVWIVPLTGAGTGTSQVGDSPPLALSWPSHPAPTPGDVLMGSSDDGVSWSLRWSAKDCPVVVVDLPKGGGTSDCLEPVRDAGSGISTVQMVASTDRGAMAFVVRTGLTLEVTATSGAPAPMNYDLTNGRWSGTRIWVMPMMLGTTYTAQAMDAAGQPVGSALTVTPGSSPSAGPSG